MRQLNRADRVGLGWRPALAPAILSHQSDIDVVEVILDNFFSADRSSIRSLCTLADHFPVIGHAVSLGLASTHPVCEKRLLALARVVKNIPLQFWSEHLAFVRAEGIEIGHLAAPPRCDESIAGTLINLQRAQKIVGSLPLLENIATLVDPPCSTLSEPEWTSAILCESECSLLLDLHNLYANAVNFGEEPFSYLKKFPLQKVRSIHLSGGHFIDEPPSYARQKGAKRLLDDHVHDVPAIVFEMLAVVAELVSQPLTVIIERDGNYPDFEIMLEQIQLARRALNQGRARRSEALHECA